jgi:predicted transcriptional regulator
MKRRTITSFISSKYRGSTDKTYDLTVDYPDEGISCKDNEYIELNVVSFDMPNNMYNINSSNNKFIITRGTTNTTYTIPEGNYSVKTFLAILQTLINDPHITITYNTAQNTYTLTKNGTSQLHYLIPDKIWGLINMIPTVSYEITSLGLTTGLVNLSAYSKVILRTQGITYYQSNLENLQNTSALQLYSDVIFWKTKTDIEPFKMISYNNEDAGNNFSLQLQDKMIFRLQLQLKNEKNEFITDAPDYTAVIQYNIYEKQDDVVKITIISILKLLNDFYISFLTLAQSMRLL